MLRLIGKSEHGHPNRMRGSLSLNAKLGVKGGGMNDYAEVQSKYLKEFPLNGTRPDELKLVRVLVGGRFPFLHYWKDKKHLFKVVSRNDFFQALYCWGIILEVEQTNKLKTDRCLYNVLRFATEKVRQIIIAGFGGDNAGRKKYFEYNFDEGEWKITHLPLYDSKEQIKLLRVEKKIHLV